MIQEYIDYLEVIVLFGVLGVIFLWVAKSFGFFSLPHENEKRSHPVGAMTLVGNFAIYLAMTLFMAPLLSHIVGLFYPYLADKTTPAIVFSWVQLGNLCAIFALFYLYCRAQNPLLFGKVWKDRSVAFPRSSVVDFAMGILTWIICFPLIIAVGQLADMILYAFFGFENYEQVAVRYLKTTLASPEMLSVALFTVLIAAPVIEEFLFRGCLQGFLKRYMPTKTAIVLSSLCFALFHFAPSQGMGNISLIATLFAFALFLGFIYERQASVFASLGLHMTFNVVSSLRILFFPD